MPDFPRDPEDLTPEWLTTKLTSTGVLAAGGRIESLSWERIGDGYAAKTVRVSLGLSEGTSGPTSVVVKQRSDHGPLLALAKRMRAYEREVHFYEQLFPGDRPPVMLDWQIAAAGSGTEDLARFALLSMRAEDRRASQRELLEAYAREHTVAGVARSADEVEAEFGAMTVFHIGSVASAIASADVTTDQGQEFLHSVMPRINAAVEDLGDVDEVLARVLR